MNVGDFLQNLSYGELSQVKAGNAGAGTIHADEINKVVSFTNTALKGLYARFSQKRDYVNIIMLDGVKEYPLKIEHNISDVDVANTAPRFIQDSVRPFTGNVVKILGIIEQDNPDTVEIETSHVSMNVTGANLGIRLLDHETLFVPEPKVDTVFRIEYQVGHAPLSIPPNLAEEIHLAPMLEEALEMRVAARVFNSMGGEAHQAKAQNLMRRYEHLCLMVEGNDLTAESVEQLDTRFANKGFV
jgi:hypothetical protein